MSLKLTLRRATPEDDSFLRGLFLDARPGLALLPDPLVDMQFRAQRLQYQSSFPHSVCTVVLQGENPVGVLWIDESDVIHLLDIAVLSAHRNLGIGGQLIDDLKTRGKAIHLHVDTHSLAMSLYERLGFVQTEDGEICAAMVWNP